MNNMLEKSIILRFPFLPCSINEAYAWYPKRHKSYKYKAFERDMIKWMACNKRYEIEGNKWLSVKYIFHFSLFFKNGNIRTRDVSNFEKVLSDFFGNKVHGIKGFDDKKIKELVLMKEDSDKEKMEVIIYEI